MKKLPISRIITLVIAGVLVLTGTFSIVKSYCLKQRFNKNFAAKPINIAVDLSKPGEFSSELKQTWRACHGQTINICIPTELANQVSPSDLLGSLKFKCRITDLDGNIVLDDESAGKPVWAEEVGYNSIPLLYFRPFDLGTYTLVFTVINGVPKMEGMEQYLICQYQPCGLELLPVFFYAIIGTSALMTAGIMIFVLIIIAKHKKVSQQEMTA